MDKKLPEKFYVSITGLKPKNFWAIFAFWRHAIPSKIQAEKSPGLLLSGVKKINGIQHTLTIWESKKHMLDYIHKDAHLKAIKSFRKIATGKTFGYEAESVPTWEEVHESWLKHGKEY